MTMMIILYCSQPGDVRPASAVRAAAGAVRGMLRAGVLRARQAAARAAAALPPRLHLLGLAHRLAFGR